MSWLSEQLRRLFGRDAYEQAKARVQREALVWLWTEAEPWVTDLLVKNGMSRRRAERLAGEIIEQVAARVGSQ